MIEVAFRVVREWDVVKVKLTNEGEERVNRLTAEGKCLACECELEPGQKVVCGCCVSCDQSQRYAIRVGKATLHGLIKIGERMPAGTPGGKPKTAYSTRLLGRERHTPRKAKGA